MKKGSLPLILGAVLVVISLCLVLIWQLQQFAAEDQCQKVTVQLEQLLPERHSATAELSPQTPMPVLQLDGQDYTALLEVPAFGLTLPVTDKWQANPMVAVPSRFAGSAYTADLVIGGKDQPGQFVFCSKIENGTILTLTDMTGGYFTYEVIRVDRAQSAQGDWLRKEEFDLTLFCRDTYSLEYIAVRCNEK